MAALVARAQCDRVPSIGISSDCGGCISRTVSAKASVHRAVFGGETIAALAGAEHSPRGSTPNSQNSMILPFSSPSPRAWPCPGLRLLLRLKAKAAVAANVDAPKDIVDTAVAAGSFKTLVAAEPPTSSMR